MATYAPVALVGLLLLAGVLPLVVGWLAGRAAVRVSPRFTHAAAFGALALLLVDFMKEAASLGQGLHGENGTIVALVSVFALGLAGASLALSRSGSGGLLAGAGAAWALAIALHSLGEGLLVGLDNVEGHFRLSFTQGASFALHKGLEGAALGAFLGVGPIRDRAPAPLLAFAAAPLLAGALLASIPGPSWGFLALAPFAAGAGATVAVLALAPREGARPDRATVAGLLVGALLVFLGGLLHEH